jgi:hypothetical protein
MISDASMHTEQDADLTGVVIALFIIFLFLVYVECCICTDDEPRVVEHTRRDAARTASRRCTDLTAQHIVADLFTPCAPAATKHCERDVIARRRNVFEEVAAVGRERAARHHVA